MSTNGETNLSLLVRNWGNEGGNRTFNIYIDIEKLASKNIFGKWNVPDFRNVEYSIPNSMVERKTKIRVKFTAPSNGLAGGIFYIRLLKQENIVQVVEKKVRII